ncbi:MAG: GTPase Era [Rhodospirillaceae bacterium]|nr:GTPase Era [Rhodospirillaceae bacterium]
MTTPNTRAGFVAIVGAPNAGKSTLVNAMVGSKVSIVSPKVQTTRMRVIGIAMADLADGGRAQAILVDTPGIFRVAKRRLERAMVAAAWRGAEDADLVALVVDAERGIGQETRAIIERLKESRAPRFVILNKIDVVPRENLLALTSELNALLPFERTFMVSALKNDGVGDVLATLSALLPAGPFLYPEDQAADLPLRLLAAEVTREQVFLQLHQELPYEAAVETEKWEDRPDGSVRIEQTIHVQRDGQRAIFLGKGGARIKQIGARARRELAEMLERPVHLFLHVKVSERWADDPAHYRTIGLDYEP